MYFTYYKSGEAGNLYKAFPTIPCLLFSRITYRQSLPTTNYLSSYIHISGIVGKPNCFSRQLYAALKFYY